jgi:hypothetical protein
MVLFRTFACKGFPFRLCTGNSGNSVGRRANLLKCLQNMALLVPGTPWELRGHSVKHHPIARTVPWSTEAARQPRRLGRKFAQRGRFPAGLGQRARFRPRLARVAAGRRPLGGKPGILIVGAGTWLVPREGANWPGLAQVSR